MEKEKIDKILHNHKVWLSTDGNDGKQANFINEDLSNTDLHNAFVNLSNVANDFIRCGFWNDNSGNNHLESLKKRVEDIYGPNGEAPNTRYYKEYQPVIISKSAEKYTKRRKNIMEKEKIDKILSNHKIWLYTEGKDGKQADFSNEDLSNVDLHNADLRHANLGNANLSNADLSTADFYKACLYKAKLHGADLRGTDLSNADLSRADLSNADLSDTNLSNADLCEAILYNTNFRTSHLCGADLYDVKDIRGANFNYANLKGITLPKGIYVAGGAGSEQRYTYYDAVNDCVICGCWNDNSGNHLESFKKRVEDIYGPNGETPNTRYYKEYQAAINYFEICREIYKKEEK